MATQPPTLSPSTTLSSQAATPILPTHAIQSVIPIYTVLSTPLPLHTSNDGNSHPDFRILTIVSRDNQSQPTATSHNPTVRAYKTVTQTMVNSITHHIPLSYNSKHNQAMARYLILNHKTLGRLKQISSSGSIPVLRLACLHNFRPFTCSACAFVAQTTLIHSWTVQKTALPGHTVRSDTVGPISPKYICQPRHVLTFLDLWTRYVIALPILSLSKLINIVPKILTMIAQDHSRRPSVFLSDNAREYFPKPIKAFLQKTDCQHLTTVPHHPEMNSAAEGINRTCLTAGRASLTHTRLPPHHWHYSILDSAQKYKNAMPHSATKHTSYQE